MEECLLYDSLLSSKKLTREEKILLAYRSAIILQNNKVNGNNYNDDELIKLTRLCKNKNDLEIVSKKYYKLLEIRDLYKESLIKYKNILENYKNLALELNINNALELSHLFSYLLWNGYLSYSKKHTYKYNNKNLLLFGMYSFDVINGQGKCLAYSEFLRDFLEVCDKKSSMMLCQMPKNKYYIDYPKGIKRTIEFTENNQELKEKVKKFKLKLNLKFHNQYFNHAITLIDDLDKLFLYDVTNLCVLDILNKNTANIINGSGIYKLNPILTLLDYPYTDDNFLLERVISSNNNSSFSSKEINDSYRNIIKLLKNKRNLLNDAYYNIFDDLRFIKEETDVIGDINKVLEKLKK